MGFFSKWGCAGLVLAFMLAGTAGAQLGGPTLPGLPDEKAGDAGNDKGEFKIGFPQPKEWHDAEQNRIERAVKNAGLEYKRYEFGRFTLYCSNARSKSLVAMLTKLEKALVKRFPKTICNASSSQSAHIVVVEGDSEWARWVNACMDSYEQDGIKFRFGPEDDPRPKLIAGNGFVLPALCVARAGNGRSNESISRFAAYSVGHLMMGRAGGQKQPVGLQTGFGDLAEAMAHRTPSVMLWSYVERDLGQARDWRSVVKDKFEARKIQDPTDPWGYTTDSMQIEHYAECWSLVATLADDPKKFAEVVSMVRNGESSLSDAIREVYKIKDKDLLKAWYRFVSR